MSSEKSASPPLVSVVIPTYNACAFVEATLRSVVEQDYPNIELIIVDDQSSDGTINLVEQLLANQDRPSKIFSAINGGQNIARNIGLALAKGVYVKFLDHDDLLPYHAISTQVLLLEQTASDLVVGSIERFTNEDESAVYQKLSAGPEASSDPEEIDHPLALCERLQPTFNEILCKRSTIVHAGGFCSLLGTCEELHLCGMLSLQSECPKIVYQASPSVLYKRCFDQSLAVQYSTGVRRGTSWGLACRILLAKALRSSNTEPDSNWHSVVLSPLYLFAVNAYRNGERGPALEGFELWKESNSDRAPLTPFYHEMLHRLFGFFGAESLLSLVRNVRDRLRRPKKSAQS